ncbi:hypothetical protein F4802DRAFT_278073 [Xylaria palmicola]|nr:hypothetical protein F4802DRAFT_278073 [Xylaria palmicola]
MEHMPFTPGTKRKYSGEQIERAVSHGGPDASLEVSGPARPGTTQHGRPARGRSAEGCGEDYFLNLYSAGPDFHQLGLKHRDFGAMLRDGVHLDFTDPAAVLQLTKTLLKEHFGLQIHLRPDRLCPPVPNRHNYILWLKDLLDSTASSYSEQYEPERRVTGLDIGTGASLIYPLLGCAQRPAWCFVATDVDADSLSSARANARLNHLESRIRIADRLASDPLIPLNDLSIDSIDFVMVNPPFYESDAELLDLATQKALPPHSACTGAPVEMVCEGGEVGFVERMIDESLVLGDRVQWYTAMLGKQSSLGVLVDVLKKHGIKNYAVTNFIQGSKTRRWALGWSFLARRPSLGASRGYGSFAAKKILPPPTAITIYESPTQGRTDLVPVIKKTLCDTIEALDLFSWTWDEQRLRGVGFAEGNVWSRAYRRRRAAGSEVGKQEASVQPSGIAACAFGFSLTIQREIPDKPSNGFAVSLRWLQGDDESIFESFVGVIRRSLRIHTTGSGAPES